MEEKNIIVGMGSKTEKRNHTEEIRHEYSIRFKVTSVLERMMGIDGDKKNLEFLKFSLLSV